MRSSFHPLIVTATKNHSHYIRKKSNCFWAPSVFRWFSLPNWALTPLLLVRSRQSAFRSMLLCASDYFQLLFALWKWSEYSLMYHHTPKCVPRFGFDPSHMTLVPTQARPDMTLLIIIWTTIWYLMMPETVNKWYLSETRAHQSCTQRREQKAEGEPTYEWTPWG